ncbi:MAG: hypothetical protein V8R83_09530 [Candidatus Gastranaerophilaceae bacterium]
MTKYIVKGCPAYHWGGCYYDGAKFECCSKNDNCSIKQVLEIYAQEGPIKELIEADDNEMFAAGILVKRILQTLGVEVVE